MRGPKRGRPIAAALSLLLALCLPAAAAHADGPRSGVHLEIDLFGGFHIFAKDVELGVADAPDLTPHPKNAGLFGMRLGLGLGPWVSIEAEGTGMPTTGDLRDDTVFIVGWRGSLLVHLVRSGFRPFLLAGAGAMSVVDSKGRYSMVDRIAKDTDPAFHAGVGFKIDFTDWLALRVDGRWMGLPSTKGDGLTNDYEVQGGLAFTIGGGEEAPPPPPPPPPAEVPKDQDGDGIKDPSDRCPAEPEDKDNFEDADGCPDPDNDGDGVLDAEDKCPLEAENKNGVDDDDGCPEKDEDGDGLVGSADKCPTEAEDKDGFQDEDGCPDPDNDGDGVLDASDRCATQPETKNGFQDEDGCPDELPKAVKKFTGVMVGINFKKNSADITKSSFKLLGKAVEVLKEYPDLRIEISGHTSTEGKRDLNMELSQKRAESVRDFLVAAGIAVERIATVGYGPDRPIADNKTRRGREKNRRIEFRLLTPGEGPGGAPTPPTPP